VSRFRRLTTALAVAALLLAGCGLPDSTEPKYVGPATNPSPAQGRAQDPPSPVGATSLSDLVVRYLKTSVGGNVTSADQPDAISETQARMKTFMTEEAREQWRPQQPLIVVDVNFKNVERDDFTGKASLVATFTQVGQLYRNGRLGPAQKLEFWKDEFTFESQEVGGQLLLSKPALHAAGAAGAETGQRGHALARRRPVGLADLGRGEAAVGHRDEGQPGRGGRQGRGEPQLQGARQEP
jgi:hypothetical protein